MKVEVRLFALLDLHVRVKAEWREDERVLTDIGLVRSDDKGRE
jgi:GTPase Era involved in 16S rRNA processing